ncbi:MAG: type III-A CRISPR-associated RAMP protein Csm3 [Fimbriimonadales bacterium]|nr:type III-A CRISPR-associated RAMP protein Csm3 [Fimbriimonadales bacterium]
MKLKEHIPIHGIIKCLTGVRIGGGGESMEIGGLDNPIVRHPLTKEPYIPGSSLKGKMRSLIETSGYTLGSRPAPEFRQENQGTLSCGCAQCVACWLFGCGDARNRDAEPTRLIFRDAFITEEDREILRQFLDEGVLYSEIKAEVTMDRKTGRVAQMGPRTMDRIMRGTSLLFECSARVYEGDNVDEMKQAFIHAARLLVNDCIGGSGSRGYGKIGFAELKFGNESIVEKIHSQEELQRIRNLKLGQL